MPQKTIDAAAGLAALALLAIVVIAKPPQVVEIAATTDALQLVPDSYTVAGKKIVSGQAATGRPWCDPGSMVPLNDGASIQGCVDLLASVSGGIVMLRPPTPRREWPPLDANYP